MRHVSCCGSDYKYLIQQLEIFENLEPKEKLTLDDKINTVIFPQRQNIAIRNKSAYWQNSPIDPKSIDAKQEVIQNVSNLLESAKRLEISFNEFFPTR